jgi:hypothetical protein
VAEEPADRRLIATRVCAELNRSGAKYVVIGGFACALHGYVCATTDVDILIERTLPNARRVLDAVSRLVFGFANEWLPKEILARPVTVIGDDPQIDIFTVAWSMKYEQAVKHSSVVEVEGVPIPLIGIDDLIETKRTGRPLDAAGLEALEEIKRVRG